MNMNSTAQLLQTTILATPVLHQTHTETTTFYHPGTLSQRRMLDQLVSISTLQWHCAAYSTQSTGVQSPRLWEVEEALPRLESKGTVTMDIGGPV